MVKRGPTYKHLVQQHLNILKKLQTRSGLFLASKKGVLTGYDKAWIRDNFYECLAFEVLGDWETVKKTYRAILDTFKKHEYKIDHAIAKKPEYPYEYIHPRYDPETFDEFWEDWGNKQNDAVGCILFRLGELEIRHKRSVIKTLAHEISMQVASMNPKDVKVLEKQEYIRDPSKTIGDLVKEAIAKLGENITIGRFQRFELGK